MATGGVRVLNDDVLASVPDVDAHDIAEITDRELRVLRRRESAYRGERPPLDLAGRTAVLIDDGIATGATMRAAVRSAHTQAKSVIVAAPVASWQSVAQLEEEADEVVCAITPRPFRAVGNSYRSFPQTSDEEVRSLLRAAWTTEPDPGPRPPNGLASAREP